MDPIAHTLTGAALAQTSLARGSDGGTIPLATATLLIGANVPDVDVLTYLHGADFALEHRRGWTHGVVAMVVLPLVLTGAMLLWDRFVRRRGGPGKLPAPTGRILALSYLGVLTHPALDWLNTYGVRLLMPFDDRWFFGDAVFIVDPWMWLILGATVILARRSRARTRIAAAGLALVAVYCLGMVAAARIARHHVTETLAARDVHLVGEGEGYRPGDAYRLMVGPVPVTPFRRQVVAVTGDGYWTGTLHWNGEFRLAPRAGLPRPEPSPRVDAAFEAPEARGFVTWVRFPWIAEGNAESVHLLDARYRTRPTTGFGGTRVTVSNK